MLQDQEIITYRDIESNAFQEAFQSGYDIKENVSLLVNKVKFETKSRYNRLKSQRMIQ